MRILIVDDDDIALEMLSMALQQAGHSTESAGNGQDALRLVREGGFRMVITDWEMPRMTGLELCAAIRNEDLPGYVYVIILTAHNTPEEVVEGLSAGADDFLTKPFNPPELVVRVRAGERVLALETRDVAIFAMAKLAESRDPETGLHLDRVRTYARNVAIHIARLDKPGYAIDQGFIRTIYLTSPLHDIGKIGIPDSILLKPGRLSDREFDVMKTHTTMGAQTLQAALDQFPDATFLTMARDIANSHHERYDGSGYPGGLVGANIPLCGRIVALADVYDALTTKRVYKNAFSHEVARSIITEESGSHFDPLVVETFLALEKEFIDTWEGFSEAAPAMSGAGARS